MKSRDGMIRAQRFQVEEKSRQVAQIEAMIADFDRKVAELDEQVRIEQDRAGIHDTGHFAYPTFAKAVAQRRDNLKASIDDLKMQLDAARMEHDTVLEELQKQEAIAERDGSVRPADVAVASQRG